MAQIIHITGTFTLFGIIRGTFEFDWVVPEPDRLPVRVSFDVPKYRDITTGAPIAMATSLKNDVISTVPLKFTNLVGEVVDPPAADVVTLAVTDTSDAPSTFATAALTADLRGVDVTPTPGDGTNLETVRIKYQDTTNTVLETMEDFEFTDDPRAANVSFDTAAITERPIT